MKKILSFTLLTGVFISVSQKAFAHCPLCTAGAGIIAAAAAAIGVNIEVVGLLVGAFAVALGFYIANRMKRTYFSGQRGVIIIGTFAVTIIPILPFMYAEPYPLVVYGFGELGTLFNRVYLIDRFVAGSIFGGFLMTVSPHLSRGLSVLRADKRIPYQSIIVTFALLIFFSLIFQFL